MKKFLIFLALCCLFCSCARRDGKIQDIQSAAGATLEEYGTPHDFVRAEQDFIATNFGNTDGITDYAVYYAADGTEFGFFRLSDAGNAPDMQNKVRAYLASERESVEALAALYPADELNARLSRFDKATVGTTGDVVYYFLTDPAVPQKVLKQFQ